MVLGFYIITTNIVIELYKGSTLISTLSPGAPNTGTFSYTPPLALTDEAQGKAYPRCDEGKAYAPEPMKKSLFRT